MCVRCLYGAYTLENSEYLEKILHVTQRGQELKLLSGIPGGVKVSWMKMFMWMFKAGEVWISYNTIKMCILVITESEINTKKMWEKKGGKNYALPTCSELIC